MAGAAHRRHVRGHLEISLRSIAQLFNSMDPAPFHEKDLDDDAEQFLVNWARELPHHAPLELVLHLAERPAPEQTPDNIAESVHNYFRERARFTRAALHQLLRQGRTSLAIGVAFLASCLLLSELLLPWTAGVFMGLVRESLTIAGWVAMWRPLQTYLYDWWPLRQQEALYLRMAHMPVDVRVSAPVNAPALRKTADGGAVF